jgi:hypothetical protein
MHVLQKSCGLSRDTTGSQYDIDTELASAVHDQGPRNSFFV